MSRGVTMNDILNAVAAHFGVYRKDISNGRRQMPQVIAARRAAIWLMREYLDVTQRDLCQKLRVTRHTVWKALKHIREHPDAGLQESIAELETALDNIALKRLSGGLFTTRTTRPERQPSRPRPVTARVLGDPPPGRSALDRRRAQTRPASAAIPPDWRALAAQVSAAAARKHDKRKEQTA